MTGLSTYTLHVEAAMILCFLKKSEYKTWKKKKLDKYTTFSQICQFQNLLKFTTTTKALYTIYKSAIEESLGHFCTDRELKIFVDLKHQFKCACPQPQPFQTYSLYITCNMSEYCKACHAVTSDMIFVRVFMQQIVLVAQILRKRE